MDHIENLKEHVTSPVVSLLLQEAGVKKETICNWIRKPDGIFILSFNGIKIKTFDCDYIPAFLSTELTDCILKYTLPYSRDQERSQFPFFEYYTHAEKELWKFDDFWTKYARNVIVAKSEREVDARAEMVLRNKKGYDEFWEKNTNEATIQK